MFLRHKILSGMVWSCIEHLGSDGNALELNIKKIKKDQMQSQQYFQEALILPKHENGYLNKVV